MRNTSKNNLEVYVHADIVRGDGVAAEDEEDGFTFISAGRRKRVLGDILICPEVLKRNAASFNVPEEEELRRLLIHGVLHLSGENHSTNDPTEPMLVHQERILSKLAL